MSKDMSRNTYILRNNTIVFFKLVPIGILWLAEIKEIDSIDISHVSNHIPTWPDYKHRIHKRDSDIGGTVFTAMTPADHKSFIRFHFTRNIAYETMQQQRDWVKDKATQDTGEILQFIFSIFRMGKIQHMRKSKNSWESYALMRIISLKQNIIHNWNTR